MHKEKEAREKKREKNEEIRPFFLIFVTSISEMHQGAIHKKVSDILQATNIGKHSLVIRFFSGKLTYFFYIKVHNGLIRD